MRFKLVLPVSTADIENVGPKFLSCNVGHPWSRIIVNVVSRH